MAAAADTGFRTGRLHFPNLLCQALICGCERSSPPAGSATHQLTVAEPESGAAVTETIAWQQLRYWRIDTTTSASVVVEGRR